MTHVIARVQAIGLGQQWLIQELVVGDDITLV